MSKRVSIKDIAEVAGVSHSTVSRALHGRGRMSVDTRDRILALADEMEYSPNAGARSLVMGNTGTIGVVVTSIADPFVSEIVSGIERAAQDAGFSVFLSSSHSDPEREIAVVETFRQRRVDAIIVTASRIGSLYGTVLDDVRVPIVLVNSQGQGEYMYSVASDEIGGARMAVEHLLALGHRRIGYIGSTGRPYSSQRRQRGYEQALHEANLEPSAALITHPEALNDAETGRLGLQALLPAEPTAIFAYNDVAAINVMLEAKSHDLSVPEMLSVLGFDDVDLTRYVTPALTTIHQPREEMGYRAMNMVVGMIKGGDAGDHILPCRLVVRDSTAPPKT